MLKCKIIGVLEVLQSEKGKKGIRNDRLIAVPRDSHREKADKDARDLPKQMCQEIEKFFVATDEMEAKVLKFLGWKGPALGGLSALRRDFFQDVSYASLNLRGSCTCQIDHVPPHPWRRHVGATILRTPLVVTQRGAE